MALFTAVMALLTAYFVLLIIAQFTDVFYYITPDNRFFYGPLYALSLVPIVLIMILNTAGTIRRRKTLSKKYFVDPLIHLVPMSVMILIQMFISVEIFIVFGVAFFALTVCPYRIHARRSINSYAVSDMRLMKRVCQSKEKGGSAR